MRFPYAQEIFRNFLLFVQLIVELSLSTALILITLLASAYISNHIGNTLPMLVGSLMTPLQAIVLALYFMNNRLR